MKYYIYHIPGIKIGCTKSLNRRIKQQGYKDYEILETHTCISKASTREIELQKEYGYKVDFARYEHSSKIGKLTPEQCSKGGKAKAPKHVKDRMSIIGSMSLPYFGQNDKLNMEQAQEIRRLHKLKVPVNEIKVQFGVSQATIYRILQNKTYKTK